MEGGRWAGAGRPARHRIPRERDDPPPHPRHPLTSASVFNPLPSARASWISGSTNPVRIDDERNPPRAFATVLWHATNISFSLSLSLLASPSGAYLTLITFCVCVVTHASLFPSFCIHNEKRKIPIGFWLAQDPPRHLDYLAKAAGIYFGISVKGEKERVEGKKKHLYYIITTIVSLFFLFVCYGNCWNVWWGPSKIGSKNSFGVWS